MAITAPSITDVIFDFCGVVIDWQSRAALAGRYPADLVDRICSDDDEFGFFDYEDRMDHGEALAEVLPVVERDHGRRIADIFKDYITRYDDALVRLLPGSEQLMRDLKAAGYGVWGLTNWSRETIHFAFEKFPQLEDILDGTVVSGVEREFKPNSDFYELALRRFGINADSSVFFDDTEKNVAGARAVGIHAFRFTDADQARRDLISLGVRI